MTIEAKPPPTSSAIKTLGQLFHLLKRGEAPMTAASLIISVTSEKEGCSNGSISEEYVLATVMAANSDLL